VAGARPTHAHGADDGPAQPRIDALRHSAAAPAPQCTARSCADQARVSAGQRRCAAAASGAGAWTTRAASATTVITALARCLLITRTNGPLHTVAGTDSGWRAADTKTSRLY
jgi:hypothetical protein